MSPISPTMFGLHEDGSNLDVDPEWRALVSQQAHTLAAMLQRIHTTAAGVQRERSTCLDIPAASCSAATPEGQERAGHASPAAAVSTCACRGASRRSARCSHGSKTNPGPATALLMPPQ
jgi:hypothetical protein